MRALYERIFGWARGSSSLGEIRKELAWTYSFAVPNDAALDELAAHGPIVEVGAGTGYWAWRLQARGVVVHAYDRTPGIPTWYPVSEGGAESVTAHPAATLLLCWPPLETTLASETLKHYRGEVLLYIGESTPVGQSTRAGESPRTGDVAFHHQLENDFVLEREVVLPRWPGFRDSLWVYRRVPIEPIGT